MKRVSYFILASLVLLAFGTVMSGVSLQEMFEGVYAFFATADGVTVAMSGALGATVADKTVTTTIAAEKSENLLRPDISQKITKIMPSTAPLDTMIREAGAHEKTDAPMFKFYSAELRAFQDKLNAAFDRSSHGDATNGYTVTVATAGLWQVDDGILFQGVNGSDGYALVAHVVAKSTTTLTVVFLNGTGEGTNIPPATIADQTKISRLGNAKSELDAKTDPYGHLPKDSYNYVQAHMAQVEESFWQAMHAKEVDWDIKDMQAMSIFDLRCRMEATSLFGVRKMVYDPVGEDYKYHSGGAVRYVGQQLEFNPDNALTNANWNNWTKKIFVGNAGSDRRYAFIGSDLMERLANIDVVQKQIDGQSTEVVFGITFKRVETPFGILMLKHHTLFNEYGMDDYGLVLDMNNIRKRVWEPMKVRKLDLMSTGEKKANAYVLEESFGLEFRYPDTHALILPGSTT